MCLSVVNKLKPASEKNKSHKKNYRELASLTPYWPIVEHYK